LFAPAPLFCFNVGEQRGTVMEDVEELQRRVDSLTRRGLFFGFFWLGGVGSVIAVALGIKAKRLIEASDGEVVGDARARGCILAGMAGILIWIVVIALMLVEHFLDLY